MGATSSTGNLFFGGNNMSAKMEKKYYSPQLSKMGIVSIRRFAWALNKPMTAALEFMVERLPTIIGATKVCESCKDRSRCKACIFVQHSNHPTALAELALLKELQP